MPADPLKTALLDLDKQLGGNAGLCAGGGYGLYLKQLYLYEHPELRTLFPLDTLPTARITCWGWSTARPTSINSPR